MNDLLPPIISGAALLLGGASFKFSYAMAQRVTALETKIELFWGVVEKQMSNLLHSPHRPTLDKLLEKNQAGEKLTKDEAEQLADLLEKLINSEDLSKEESSWATMLLAITVAKYGIQSN